MALELTFANIVNIGDQLRAVNAEIKSTLLDIGKHPVGSTPYDVATALNNLQQKYNEARELYTTIYRVVYGDVPIGLSQLAAVPLAAWISLVIAMGVLYTLLQALRDAIQKWREGQAGSLQQSKIQVLQDNLNKAQATGDTAAVAFYQQQLAALVQQSAMPSDWGVWLQQNALWVGLGALGVILLLRKS